MEAYIKKFGNLSKDKADKLKKDLLDLNSIKLNAEHIVKIIDFLPKDEEDLNKILNEVSLSFGNLPAMKYILSLFPVPI